MESEDEGRRFKKI